MLIKYASSEDKQHIKDIWSICFPEDHDPFLSWFFDNVYKPANTLAAYEDDTIAANLQLIPYKISFHNIPINIRYLVGAATLPEFRKRGIMASLLKSAVSEARNNDCPFILLLPFNYAFYRKYGWEACYFHNQYNTHISNIKNNLRSTGVTSKVHASSYIPVLDNIYRRSNTGKNGWLLRTDIEWLNMIQDHQFSNGHTSIFTDNNGSQTGYMLYKIENGTFEIVEMACLDSDAAQGIWNYIATNSEGADKILWKSPVDDISYMFFDDPRNTCKVEPFVMARAVNVEKVLQLLVSGIISNINIYLNIEDLLAPWNNGIFHICKSSGKGTEITRLNSNHSSIDAVCMSINTFSMLSMGVISPSEAKRYGLINILNENNTSDLDILFKKTINFMNEYF